MLDELRTTQALLKTHRGEEIRPADCTLMRRTVMSIIEDRRESFGWALRIERTIVLGFGLRPDALAAIGLIALVSASVLAQIRHTTPAMTTSAAVFERGNTLVRPEGYRDWVRVAPSSTPIASGIDSATGETDTRGHRVYINPVAYREYQKAGRFPDGTLMIWEPASGGADMAPHPHDTTSLLASVKDSRRFDGGWGFFDFSGTDGTVTARAQARGESSSCATCHRQHAETDHVFTQFYPVLQSARRAVAMQPGVPPDLTDVDRPLPHEVQIAFIEPPYRRPGNL